MKKLSTKKLRELLADAHVHNEHQLLRPVRSAPPVVSYRKSDRHQYARWMVTRVGYKTDPEHGHFLDGHNKTFVVRASSVRESERAIAIDWASEQYGYTAEEWVKTPFGSWTPKSALDAALRHHLPELFETTVYVPPTVLPDVRPLAEAVQHVPSVETDGWYRVLGANVAVFIQATDVLDARERVEHMINHMMTDASLALYVRPARKDELS